PTATTARRGPMKNPPKRERCGQPQARPCGARREARGPCPVRHLASPREGRRPPARTAKARHLRAMGWGRCRRRPRKGKWLPRPRGTGKSVHHKDTKTTKKKRQKRAVTGGDGPALGPRLQPYGFLLPSSLCSSCLCGELSSACDRRGKGFHCKASNRCSAARASRVSRAVGSPSARSVHG